MQAPGGSISAKYNWRLPTYTVGLLRLLGGVGFVGLIGLVEYWAGTTQDSLRQSELKLASQKLAGVANGLVIELNAIRYFSLGLKTYIEANMGRLDEATLAPWLTELQARGTHVRNIALAPNNRVSYVYPLAGNEAILGVYYPDLANQWPGVKAVIESRQPKLIGPFPLVQSGLGLVYREAIFLDNNRYWGIVSSVMSADSLFASMHKLAETQGLVINIWDSDSSTWIMPGEVPKTALEERLSVAVPGRDWQVVAFVGKQGMDRHLWLTRIGGWLFVMLSFFLGWRMLHAMTERERVNYALYQSQERFARVFNSSPQALALVDDQHNWLEINDSFKRMLGWDIPSLNGTSIAELFEPNERDRVRTMMDVMRASADLLANQFEQFEARLHCHTGVELMALVSLGICYRKDHQIHWVLQCIDITERLRLEAMKQEFVSTVSHELRTPLTSIVGGLKLLSSGHFTEFNAQANKILEIALHNGNRLSLLINDLLDMEKLLAGKMVFHFGEQELCALTRLVLESLRSYADQFQVAVSLQAATEPVIVTVDELRIQQVISNLLSNAIKFSAPGAKVQVTIEVLAQVARLKVRDYGDGVAPEDRHKLFKKFSQVDSSSTRKKGGTGLGLAISKELIEGMGGSIGFIAPENGGACFYIDIPLSLEAERQN